MNELIIELSEISPRDFFGEQNVNIEKLKELPNFLLDDIDEQLEVLLPPYEAPLFIFNNLRNYPRYLLALKIRIEKYNQRKAIDQEASAQINRLQQKWIEKVSEYVEEDLMVPSSFVDFQWELQELRVSIFAQELKTPSPVSMKRLDKKWITLIN